MTRSSPPQFAFSSGEISPLLHGRPDYQRYQTGLRASNGWLTLRQGGVTRSPGTIFRGFTDGNNQGRRIPFEFAENDALELEFTNLKMRVWRYGALVEVSPGVPYELATPYDLAAVQRMQYVQSADVIYLADGARPIQRLARLALDNWTIGDFQIDNGPFRVRNLDEDVTIQASAETGTITLTASQALFGADWVGTLVSLEPVDLQTRFWYANQDHPNGIRRRYNGNLYELAAGGGTGGNPPIHTEGTRYYGSDVAWTFLSDSRGVVRITGFTSATSVTAEVLKRVPQDCVTDASYRWAEGAWSDKFGYPTCLEIHDQRLVAAATDTDPRTLWFSEVGSFSGFEPGTDDDDAFAYSVSGSESLNRIRWLRSGKRGLAVGTLGEVFTSRSNTAGQAIGPTTFELGVDAGVGVLPVRPISPDGRPIFISKDARRVFELRFQFSEDENEPIELSLPSEHLGAVGFHEIAWQSAVQRVAWLRRGDGTLAAMLYDPQEDVLGWVPLSVAGGFVESICTSPDPETGQDLLKMIVRRQINGQTVRMIEDQPLPYGVLSGTQPISEAIHLFASSVFVSDPPQATFSVPHLAGEDVHAWTDLGNYGPLSVAQNGDVTLPDAVGRATIGLLDEAHDLETLPVVPQAADGSAMGRKQRVHVGSAIRVHRTAALKAQICERSLDGDEFCNPAREVIATAVAGVLTQAKTGLAELPLTSGWREEQTARFLPVGGAPATILGWVPMAREDGG